MRYLLLICAAVTLGAMDQSQYFAQPLGELREDCKRIAKGVTAEYYNQLEVSIAIGLQSAAVSRGVLLSSLGSPFEKAATVRIMHGVLRSLEGMKTEHGWEYPDKIVTADGAVSRIAVASVVEVGHRLRLMKERGEAIRLLRDNEAWNDQIGEFVGTP